MLDQDELKRRVARAAIEYVPRDGVIGVGTGSTANYLIDMLGEIRHDIKGAVASSIETERRLKAVGIEVLDLNMTGDLAVYIDGADEANDNLQLIKGGGAALTREKIVAGASREFICIVDHTKRVDILGTFPLPVEVIPMARSFVARQLVRLGGDPELREDTRTDNNNLIIDIHNLDISQPIALEREINQIPGVVTAGLFAVRPADVLLTALADGNIETITA